MTTGTLTEALVEFQDNRLLIDLCGQFDSNLTAIESRLGVQILRRGNQLVVVGDPSAQDEARLILQSLYERLEQGRTVEPSDIDRAIRMSAPEPEEDDKGDQLEMFSGGGRKWSSKISA